MRKTLTLLLFVFMMGEMVGQCNLVPNWSFENITSGCANVCCGISSGYAPPWDIPNGNSPDLFNSCDTVVPLGGSVPFNFGGFQPAHSGNGYCGIGVYPDTNAREYIQVELDSTLINQGSYCVSFFVNPTNLRGLATNNMGMYFSNTHVSIIGHEYLNFTPQINCTTVINDTLNWTEISGTYTATGGERYIIIGNFYSDALTDTLGIPTPHPWGTHNAYYYIDDVNVHRCSCDDAGVKELTPYSEITLYPNPCASQLGIKNYELGIKEVSIYNALGSLIRN